MTLVTSGELRLWVDRIGDPADPAVLLIAGAEAQGIGWPSALVDRLVAGGLQVIRYDHRDTGESDSVDFDESPYSIVDLVEDAVVLVRGRLDKREETPKLIASDITVPDLSTGPRGPVVVTLPAQRCTPPLVDRLKDVLAAHPGTTEVHLSLSSSGKSTVVKLDDKLRVTATASLFADLKALLGPGCLT